MRKFLWFLLPRLLFLTAAVLLILTARGWQFDFEERTFHKTGILDMQSTPKGAGIILDNEIRGKTPGKIAGLLPGRYQLTLSLTGYHPWQKFVTVHPELVTAVRDVLLFPLTPRLQPVETAPFERALTTPDKQLLVMFSRQDTLTEVSLQTAAGIRLFSGLQGIRTPLDADLIDLYQSEDGTFLIMNLFAADRARLEQSYAVDVRAQQIREILPTDLPFAFLDQLAGGVVFIPQSHRLLLRDAANALVSYDPINRTETVIATPDVPLIPLWTTTPGLFSDARLYRLEPDAEGVYRFGVQGWPNGQDTVIVNERAFLAPRHLLRSPDEQNLFFQDEAGAVLITNIDDTDRGVDILPRAVERPLGWSPDGQSFLFVSDDRQIAYYDQAKDKFLFPYGLPDNEVLQDACWHPNNQYIFFVTAPTDGSAAGSLQVIEKDGKNLLTLLRDNGAQTLTLADRPLLDCRENEILLQMQSAADPAQKQLQRLPLY
jgi:hypothetical protein